MKRAKDKFYYKCNHICIYCGFKLLSTKQSCIKCNCSNVNSVVRSSQKMCSGCNQEKYTTESLLLEICDNHIHCYDCLVMAWKTTKCQHCQKMLDFQSKRALKIHLFCQCHLCLNMVDVKFVIEKKCCLVKVCIYCQKKHKENNCKSCGYKLSANIIRRLGNLA